MTSARLVQLSRAATAEFFSTRKVIWDPNLAIFVPFFWGMKVDDDQKKKNVRIRCIEILRNNVVLKHDTKDSISLA